MKFVTRVDGQRLIVHCRSLPELWDYVSLHLVKPQSQATVDEDALTFAGVHLGGWLYVSSLLFR